MLNKNSNLKTFDCFPAKLRQEYFVSSAVLRVFACYEQPAFRRFTNDALRRGGVTLEQLLNSGSDCRFCLQDTGDNKRKSNLKDVTLHAELVKAFSQLIYTFPSPYLAYHLYHSTSCYCDIFTKLSRKGLKPEHFTADCELTPLGIQYRDEVRKKWEHCIELPINLLSITYRETASAVLSKYYFSSTEQLYHLIMSYLESVVEESCETFIDKLNTTLLDSFNDLLLDGKKFNGPQLYEAMKLRLVTHGGALMRPIIQEVVREEVKTALTHLLLTYQTDVNVNLVDIDNISRMIGQIQYRQTTTPPPVRESLDDDNVLD